MQYKTYREFYDELTEALPGWEIILGTTKDGISGDTCFINQRGGSTVYSDGVPFVQSVVYDVILLQERAAFTNVRLFELVDDGINFTAYDENSGMNVFLGQVTLLGPGGLPDE